MDFSEAAVNRMMCLHLSVEVYIYQSYYNHYSGLLYRCLLLAAKVSHKCSDNQMY